MSDAEHGKAESLAYTDHNAAKQGPPRRRRLLLAGLTALAVLVVVGLAVGLGVGLTLRNKNADDGGDSDESNDLPVVNNSSTNASAYWRPAVGVTWNYQLLDPLTSTSTQGIQVWDIDLFNNDADIITGMQSNGAHVVCYFSAGSYEDWRPDKGAFDETTDLGKPLKGWAGERWLNTSSQNVRKIMQARLDMAVSKHCDGVDPDNIDAYANANGLGMTQADAIDYVTFLAEQAHARNLSVGLKNAGAIVHNVVDIVDFSVNEQCTQYSECGTYAPLIEQSKPVFHVEYPKGDKTNNNQTVDISKYCSDPAAKGFSTIIKNMNLDSWLQTC